MRSTERDPGTGVLLVRDGTGTYLGYVDRDPAPNSRGWYASQFDAPLLRHVYTGGFHRTADLAALALGAPRPFRGGGAS